MTENTLSPPVNEPMVGQNGLMTPAWVQYETMKASKINALEVQGATNAARFDTIEATETANNAALAADVTANEAAIAALDVRVTALEP